MGQEFAKEFAGSAPRSEHEEKRRRRSEQGKVVCASRPAGAGEGANECVSAGVGAAAAADPGEQEAQRGRTPQGSQGNGSVLVCKARFVRSHWNR